MDHNEHILIKLTIWLGVLGFGVYAIGLSGHLTLWFITPLLSPVLYYAWKYVKNIGPSVQFSRLGRGEKYLVFGLIAQFTLYALGLFVPETSFDALWYHLPLAQVYASTGRIAHIPELLYSTMPRLGDMYLVLGFLLYSPIAVKLISFSFATLFVLLSYHLSRQFLPRFYALLTALVVNSLYLVAWQSTAGYVDLTRAVFELAALLCLLKIFTDYPINQLTDKRLLVYSALLTGFALSVKFQAIIFFIASITFLVVGLSQRRASFKRIVYLSTVYCLLSIVIALPWYFDNYRLSGHPLYPTNLFSLQKEALRHAGANSLPHWLQRQTARFPLFVYDLSANPAQQLTPLILILLPLVVWRWRSVTKLPITQVPLTLFILCYLTLWWFLPPPESRYALSAIPPLIAIEFFAISILPKNYHPLKRWVIIFSIITVGLNYSIRLAASVKFLPLLTHRQTPQQYIDSQTTDFNRSIMKKYHTGYWEHYQYPK